MLTFSPILILILIAAIFMISSFLFLIFKIALIAAIIKFVYEFKEEIKNFIINLTEGSSNPNKFSNHETHRNKYKQKEVKEFTEVKPTFKNRYNDGKDYNSFKRVK